MRMGRGDRTIIVFPESDVGVVAGEDHEGSGET